MSQNLGWKDAIHKVLSEADSPMHYSAIADEIAERELRSDLGATPAATVASVIAQSLQKEGITSPFMRTGRALYALRKQQTSLVTKPVPQEEAAETTGLVNAFGMFWDRAKVFWEPQPSILGQQQTNSRPVDFCEQKGVYLLHDAQGVVYVGRADKDSLGRRLYQHTIDRHTGRWTRFSWFGVYPAEEKGTLNKSADFSRVDIETVIVTMEAVLIEGLEPRQNRKRGDDFKAVEFLQVEDPKLDLRRKQELMNELAAKLGK